MQAQSFMLESPVQVDGCSISLLVLTWLRAVTAAPVAAGMKDERNPSSRHRMAGSIVSQLRNDRLPDIIRMACVWAKGSEGEGGGGGIQSCERVFLADFRGFVTGRSEKRDRDRERETISGRR